MATTVTGPFPVEAKADKPVYKVIVVTTNENGTYADHLTWEGVDAGDKADALHRAQHYADQVRRQSV